MKRKREWLILLSVTVLLFSRVEAQQKRPNSNEAAKTARSSTTYDAYVGQYLLSDEKPQGDVITITKVGARLIAERYSHGWDVFELFPQSRDTFIHKFKGEGTISITFIKDMNGRVPQLKLIYTRDDPSNNEVLIVNRISSLTPYTPSSQKLSEYVGQYQVKTGGPINDYTVEDGVLYVSDKGMMRNGVVEKMGFFPDAEDRFLSKKYHMTLTFMRDERGKVTQVEVVKSPTYKFVARRL